MLTEIDSFPQQNHTFEFFSTEIIPSGALNQLQQTSDFS